MEIFDFDKKAAFFTEKKNQKIPDQLYYNDQMYQTYGPI